MSHDATDDRHSSGDDEECIVAFRYKGIATAPSGRNMRAAGVNMYGKLAVSPTLSSRTNGVFGSAMRAMRGMAGMNAVLPETKCAHLVPRAWRAAQPSAALSRPPHV